MDDVDYLQEQVSAEEMAAFCFRKMAHLEARFIMLCHRAEAAGIACTDLCHADLPSEDDMVASSPDLPN